jgi:glycosyltransferase involved in cell wall biosynthesis
MRVVGGFGQLVRDVIRYTILIYNDDLKVTHLVSSGQFGVIRDLVFIFLSRILKIPIVYHLRFGRVPEISQANTVEWRILSLAARLARCVIVLDRATKIAMEDLVGKSCIKMIPNCADTDSLRSYCQNYRENIILFLGHVKKAKGVEDLLAAWEKLKEINDWKLVFAGVYEDTYLDYLRDNYDLKKVYFLGELSHDGAMDILGKSKIFVLPSHTEGFPNSVLEAMSLGTTVVATPVGAIPEMIENGSGVLVNIKDPDGLASTLLNLMGDEEKCSVIGEAGKKRAQDKYSLERVFGQYREVWMRVVAE